MKYYNRYIAFLIVTVGHIFGETVEWIIALVYGVIVRDHNFNFLLHKWHSLK